MIVMIVMWSIPVQSPLQSHNVMARRLILSCACHVILIDTELTIIEFKTVRAHSQPRHILFNSQRLSLFGDFAHLGPKRDCGQHKLCLLFIPSGVYGK